MPREIGRSKVNGNTYVIFNNYTVFVYEGNRDDKDYFNNLYQSLSFRNYDKINEFLKKKEA